MSKYTMETLKKENHLFDNECYYISLHIREIKVGIK